ncbi:MAG: HNH endonuclease [Geminicoccaceae bacterium]
MTGKKKRRKSVKKSWYWGNARWNRIRDKRKEENSSRYRLPAGTCKCERCAKVIKGKSVHVDHIWPRKPYWFLQYCYWNTQILCDKCNTKKSNKRGHNWRRWRQMRLHPVVWFLRWRQHRLGLR